MEELKELKNQVASLRQYAKDVEPVMAAVMMLMDHQTKKEVLDYLDAVVIKLNEVADMIDRLSTKDVQPDQSAPSEQTSKDDLSHWMAEIQLHHRQLGEVLDDMVSRQDELTAEDFVWMMDYIAQTRCTLNCFLNDGKHTLNLPPNYFFNEKEG